MAKRRKAKNGYDQGMMVLIIIASVLLSAGIFYAGLPTVGMPLIGDGFGPPPMGGCSSDFCGGCTDKTTCTSKAGCDWVADVGGGGSCVGIVNRTKAGTQATTDSTTVAINGAGVSNVELTMDVSPALPITITVKELQRQPSLLAAPSGIPYAYYLITSTAGAEVTGVKITFTVSDAWMEANNIDYDKIKVWRAGTVTGAGTVMDQATTTIPHAGSAPGTSNVIGEAAGFSYWAITGYEACGGTVALSLPGTAAAGSTVTATVSGLSNCAGGTAHIRKDSCTGTLACDVATGNTGGSCTFTAPTTADVYGYAACIDIDKDGSFTTDGEEDTATIEITATGQNETGGGNETGGETGGAICGNRIIESGEECDKTNLGGLTCSDVGDFTGGTLMCSSGCTYDTSACIAAEQPPEEEEVTAAEALAAINAATKNISAARNQGKDVSDAVSMLNEAISAYNDKDYATAKMKAEAAVLAIPGGAPPAELPLLYIAIGIAAIAAVGLAAYFLRKRKGRLHKKVKVQTEEEPEEEERPKKKKKPKLEE